MFGIENVCRALWLTSLILTTTGVAISAWSLQSPGLFIIYGAPEMGGQGIGGRELGPGETTCQRGYVYFHDDTKITVTADLHPLMSYNFSISKINGSWRYKKSGTGHDVFSFEPPERGVYEYIKEIRTPESASQKLRGIIGWTVRTQANREAILFYSLIFLVLPGTMLQLVMLVARVAKHVW